jgi:hypothetical protein
MQGPLNNFDDGMELTYRGPATLRPSAQLYTTSPKIFTTPKTSKRQAPGPSTQSRGAYDNPQQFNLNLGYDGIDILGRPLPPGSPSQRPSAQLLKAIKRIPDRVRGLIPVNIGESVRGIPGRIRDMLPHAETIRSVPRRIRGMFPIRAAANGENAPLIGQRRRLVSFGKFLNTHKRKLIIGGGVIGGAAIVGGTIAGIQSAKRRKSMQVNGENTGMFQKLTTGAMGSSGFGGGGGNSGFARYQQMASAANSYGGQATKRRYKKASKKGPKKGPKKAKANGKKKTKKGVKQGRVRKSGGKKSTNSINKRRKHGKSKKSTAF